MSNGNPGRRAFRFATTAVLLLAAACTATEEARYYTLTAELPRSPAPMAATATTRPLVTVGPVQVPSHLDRPQIVNSERANVATMAEFDRWVEPLSKSLTRVMVENLTRARPDYLVTSFDGSGPGTIDYQVVVDVSSIELRRGQSVTLSAYWRIIQHRTVQSLAQGRTTVDEAVSGNGFDAIAMALSRASARLSADVAEALPRR